MSSLQRIASVTHSTAKLIAQLRELDRLREQVSKAILNRAISRRTNRQHHRRALTNHRDAVTGRTRAS
jgi:hypothetical protein